MIRRTSPHILSCEEEATKPVQHSFISCPVHHIRTAESPILINIWCNVLPAILDFNKLLANQKNSKTLPRSAPTVLSSQSKAQNGATVWMIPSKTVEWSNGALSSMTRDINYNQLSWTLNKTQIILYSTSQHSAIWWSDPGHVRKEAGLRDQRRTVRSTLFHTATLIVPLLQKNHSKETPCSLLQLTESTI